MRATTLLLALLACFSAANAHSYFSAVAEGEATSTTGVLDGYIHKGEIFWTLNVSSADAFTGASLADGNPKGSILTVVKLVNLLDGGKAPLDGDAYFEGSFNSTDILPAAGYNTTELFSHFDMGHIYLQLESAGGKVYGAVEKDAPKAAPAPGAAPEHMHGRKMLL